MTIAHNLAVDRLRRETGARRPTLVLVDEVPDVPGASEEDAIEERDAATRALESLTEAERRLPDARVLPGAHREGDLGSGRDPARDRQDGGSGPR